MGLDTTAVRRIMVRGTNWVGDAVMTLPALAALRDNFPEAHIAVLARPWVRPVYAAHPAVDRVMSYDRPKGLAALARLPRLADEIRREHFDVAVLLQNAFEAAAIAFLARIPQRVGYDTDGRRWLLTHPVRRDRAPAGAHQSRHYLALLGEMALRADFSPPRLRVAEDDDQEAGRLLAARGVQTELPLVGFSPGAIYGPAKRWPAERFAALADMAADRWGARVLVFGSSRETDVCRAVTNAMAHPAVDLCGATSLGAAMGLIGRCRVFVSNDSGLMHVAAALGVPTVAIFGSTDPVATGPLGAFTRVVRVDTPCAPCLLRTCPIDFRCMHGVTVDAVWHAMVEIERLSGSAAGDHFTPPTDVNAHGPM